MTDGEMLAFTAGGVCLIFYGAYKAASWIEHRHDEEQALSKRIREKECRVIELPEPKAGWGKTRWKYQGQTKA